MPFNAGGAGQGAVTGGIAGSAFGPVGTGVGAVLGGVFGGFGGGGPKPYKPNRDNFNVHNFGRQYDTYGRLSTALGNRNAPQMAGAQMGDSAFRGDQTALVRMLQQQAAGRGPGQELVRRQAQDAADRGLKQQLAMASGGGPGGGAMGARSAALAGGQIQSAVGQQAAMGGLQAQLGAVGQLGGVLDSARGMDLQRNQANMQSQLATQQGNLNASQAQMNINDQARFEALRQRQALSGMQQAGGMAYEGLRAGGVNGMAQATAGQPSWFDRTLGQIGGLGRMNMTAGPSQGQPTAPSGMWAPSQSMYPGLGR